jgi:hypothetical protein
VADVPTPLITGDRSWIEVDTARYPNATAVTAAVAGFLNGTASTAAP